MKIWKIFTVLTAAMALFFSGCSTDGGDSSAADSALPTVSASLSDYTVNVTVTPASKETDTVITYTWYKNGVKTSDTGATTDTTVVNGVDTYKCVVTATYKGKTVDVENSSLETSKDNWVTYYKTTVTSSIFYSKLILPYTNIYDEDSYSGILTEDIYNTQMEGNTFKTRTTSVVVYSYDGKNFYTEKDTSSTLVYPVTTTE